MAAWRFDGMFRWLRGNVVTCADEHGQFQKKIKFMFF